MKIRILLSASLLFFTAINARCLQSHHDDEKALIATLLTERTNIDTLFSKDELNLIEGIRQSIEGKITAANVDLILKSCYQEVISLLNEHKKTLQSISRRLFNECLIKHGDEADKKDIRKLKFITSPLPLILLVDYRFINLFEL